MGAETLIRVVVDTNVLVSAMRHGTTTRQVADLWLGGRVRLLVSREIIEEYLRVLSYPKLQLIAQEIKRVIEEVVLPYADVVQPGSSIPTLSVPEEDLKFLACAIGGKADYLVTGDRALLRLGHVQSTQIVTPAVLLKQLLGRSPSS